MDFKIQHVNRVLKTHFAIFLSIAQSDLIKLKGIFEEHRNALFHLQSVHFRWQKSVEKGVQHFISRDCNPHIQGFHEDVVVLV